jgi:hypothetical protein
MIWLAFLICDLMTRLLYEQGVVGFLWPSFGAESTHKIPDHVTWGFVRVYMLVSHVTVQSMDSWYERISGNRDLQFDSDLAYTIRPAPLRLWE